MRDLPTDVRNAARWLNDQPLTLPEHVRDHLDVVLAYLLGHTTRPAACDRCLPDIAGHPIDAHAPGQQPCEHAHRAAAQ